METRGFCNVCDSPFTIDRNGNYTVWVHDPDALAIFGDFLARNSVTGTEADLPANCLATGAICVLARAYADRRAGLLGSGVES